MRLFQEYKRKAELRKKRRTLQLEYDRVYELYEKDIAAAKDYETQQQLEQAQHFECGEYEDAMLRMDSLDITRRGKRCHIAVSDFELPPQETRYWIQGNHGDYYIHPKVFREFAKAVEAAEHELTKRDIERRDFWLKVVTAILAALAAVASTINLVRKW